jgi:hypothetical protein
VSCANPIEKQNLYRKIIIFGIYHLNIDCKWYPRIKGNENWKTELIGVRGEGWGSE